MSPQFDALYAKLLRALLLHVLYSIRSERMLMEQLDYNLLFRWFVGHPTVDFHGEKRSNETHESKTDPDARLARKSGASQWRGHKDTTPGILSRKCAR